MHLECQIRRAESRLLLIRWNGIACGERSIRQQSPGVSRQSSLTQFRHATGWLFVTGTTIAGLRPRRALANAAEGSGRKPCQRPLGKSGLLERPSLSRLDRAAKAMRLKAVQPARSNSLGFMARLKSCPFKPDFHRLLSGERCPCAFFDFILARCRNVCPMDHLWPNGSRN